MAGPPPPDMLMVVSVVKLVLKSPSPAICSLAETPLAGQSPSTTKPPVAVRTAVSLAQAGPPSVGSMGLPVRHLVEVWAAAPSWLDARFQSPAAGAGRSATSIGPAGPAG